MVLLTLDLKIICAKKLWCTLLMVCSKGKGTQSSTEKLGCLCVVARSPRNSYEPQVATLWLRSADDRNIMDSINSTASKLVSVPVKAVTV